MSNDGEVMVLGEGKRKFGLRIGKTEWVGMVSGQMRVSFEFTSWSSKPFGLG